VKKRVLAKVGTHSSCILVLWNDLPYKEGDWIYAMKAELYDSLHWSWRRLKHNGMWTHYYVDKIGELLFVHR